MDAETRKQFLIAEVEQAEKELRKLHVSLAISWVLWGVPVLIALSKDPLGHMTLVLFGVVLAILMSIAHTMGSRLAEKKRELKFLEQGMDNRVTGSHVD